MADEAAIRRLEREKKPAPPEWFTGRVEIEAIFGIKDIQLNQGRVHFHDGARTNWHLHTGDQVLYWVDGKGMAQDLGGDVLECNPGDIVHVPGGTRHIHGAFPGHSAVQLAVTHGESIWDNDPRYPK